MYGCSFLLFGLKIEKQWHHNIQVVGRCVIFFVLLAFSSVFPVNKKRGTNKDKLKYNNSTYKSIKGR